MPTEPPFNSPRNPLDLPRPNLTDEEWTALRDALNGPDLDLWIDEQIERHERRGRLDTDDE